MTNDDDNELRDHDLSAWAAPAPPGDLADAVIARVSGIPAAPARVVTPRPRWIVPALAGVGVLVAGAATWFVIGRGIDRDPAAEGRPGASTHALEPAAGIVAAEGPREVVAGGATAQVDGGAELAWTRHGDRVRVMQRQGAATWRVDAVTRLHIDVEAAVASIEATGASLRVEVAMKPDVAHPIIRGTAVVSTVSLLAVAVYAGTVEVTHDGKTAVVAPGTTYTVPAPTPAPVPTPPANAQTIAVLGLEVAEPYGEKSIAIASRITAGLRMKVASSAVHRPAPNASRELVDEKLMNGCEDESPRCMAAIGRNLGADLVLYGTIREEKNEFVITLRALDVAHEAVRRTITDRVPSGNDDLPALDQLLARTYDELTAPVEFDFSGKPAEFDFSGEAAPAGDGAVPEALDRAAIQNTVMKLRPDIQKCAGTHGKSGKLKIRARIAPSGRVASASAVDASDPELGKCVVQVFTRAQFPRTKTGGSFTYPLVLDP